MSTIIEIFNSELRKLNDKLNNLKIQYKNIFLLTEKAIGICSMSLLKLKDYIAENEFQDKDEEIHFFKHLKPKISSKLIFYLQLFEIESYRPMSGAEMQISYLNKCNNDLQLFFSENMEFCQYYWRNQDCFDDKYFIRENNIVRIHPDSFYSYIDNKFSTAFDTTVAKIIASEQLKKYISNEVQKLNNSANFISGVEWTGKNVDAAELIYAMVSIGVINNGNIEIRELARLFEKMFNIKLDDIYKMFQYIQRRTDENKTKFLDQLKNALLRRLDEMEE